MMIASMVIITLTIGSNSIAFESKVFEDQKTKELWEKFYDVKNDFINNCEIGCEGHICVAVLTSGDTHYPHEYFISVGMNRWLGFILFVNTREEIEMEDRAVKVYEQGFKFSFDKKKYIYRQTGEIIYRNENMRRETIESKEIWDRVFVILLKGRNL